MVGVNSGVLRKGQKHLAIAVAGDRFGRQLRRMADGRAGAALSGPEARADGDVQKPEAEGQR